MARIRSREGGRGATGRKNRGLAGVRQSDYSGHRLAQEKVREQEENEANLSRGSEGATTARGLARLG